MRDSFQNRKSRHFRPVVLGLLIQFVLELVSGAILSTAYKTAQPHGSVIQMHDSGAHYLQSFHYWQSSLLIAEGFILVATMLWRGLEDASAKRQFLFGLLVFGSSLGFQITGNLLPFDRHGVQTAVIEASIAARAPLVGGKLENWALGGDQFSLKTLQLWYLFHWGLVGLALLAIGLGLSEVKSGKKRTNFAFAAALSCPGILLAFIPSPLGSQATSADYSAFADQASWYTWPLHGALVLFSRLNPSLEWIGAMLIPSLFGLFWLGLLLWKPQATVVGGRISLVLFLGFFGFAACRFGGSFDSLTGSRDPIETATVDSKAKVSPIDQALATQGRSYFNSVGCTDCHGKDASAGKAGPSLLQIQTKHPEADYFVRFVKNPQAIDPNSTMPGFPQLTQSQLLAIAEYLRSPKKS